MSDRWTKRHHSIPSYLNLLKSKRVLGLLFLSAGLLFAAPPLRPISARAAGVALGAAPASRTVTAGQTVTYTVNLNRDQYTDRVTLNASNLPAGATASFSPNPTTGKSSVLTVSTKTTTPAGTFKLKIGGSATGISIAPINVTLQVQPAPSVKLSAIPDSISIIAGQTATADIHLARTNYDGAVLLAAENLPEGVSVTFDHNPASGLKTTMRLYSPGLPHVSHARDIYIKASLRDLAGPFDLLPVRLLVNCGIDWVEQYGSDQTDARHTDVDANGWSIVDGRNGDVTVAPDGNIYVVGNTHGTVDPRHPNQGATDVWLAKFNSAGQRLWTRQLGTNEVDRATEVAADNAGNVFMGGFTAGAMPDNFSQGNMDFWVAKYDSAGNFHWVAQGGTQGQDGRFGLVIVPDGAGGGKLVTFTTERSRIRTYTFDPSGTLMSQSGFPHLFSNTPYDLALGPNDTIYVVGAFTNLGGLPNEYVIKYDSQGNELWRNTYGSQNPKLATRIALDATGNAYVAGHITPSPPAVPHPKAWIAKYDGGSGGSLWTKYEPGELFNLNNDLINAVGIDGNGDVVIAGMTEGVLGERNGDAGFPGTADAWVSRRRSSDGELVWVRQFPVSDVDGFDALAFDHNKGIILSGYTVAFKNNIGLEDALLLRYVDSTSGTTVRLLPYVTGVNPAASTVGRTVSINGVNFFGITGVRFNGVPALYTIVSITQIDAVVPIGATTGLITLSQGCSSFTSPAPFTVLP